ncbi:hypothetical protein AKJ55_01585 [candidate division MSBL1 archaeon SCGC-AAA382M17]|uniref:MCM domain-containing protein n=1 Tax=candidate division MSBL1 archaeon SCGC-AAA382M17 TaxID=1698284 RepID=A0ABR5TJD2_9EURY|nr:hypothetical protein AKJ55_01585 [candidate division MSBL1 archaeon SCGC-AAA382M17]
MSENQDSGLKVEIEKRKSTRPNQSVVLLAKIREKGGVTSGKFPSLRIYLGDRSWCYTVGLFKDGKFELVKPEISSGKPPWQSSSRLWNKLEKGLEQAGVSNPREALRKTAMTIDNKGGSKIFKKETPDEAENEVFEEEDIPSEALEEADSVIEEGMVIPKILEIYDEVHIGDYERKILLECSFLSKRLTGNAIHDHAVGTSGKGKSHLMRIMSNGVPNENILSRDSISPKYLYYLTKSHGPDCLNGTVVYYDDVTLDEEKEATLKTLTDPGPSDRATHGTVEDQEKIDLTIDGLPVVLVSSVDTFESEQMRNRFFIDHPNESEELDKEVAEHQKKFGRRGVLNPERDIDYDLAKAIYRGVVENASDFDVLIPFDYDWEYTSDRRLQPLFLRLLYTITKISHAKRVQVEGHLLATFEDFYLAKMVMETFLLATAEKMTDKMKDVWEALPPCREEGKTRAEISEESGLSYGKVRYNLEGNGKLKDLGFANAEKDEGEWKYWKTEKGVVKTCVRLSQRVMTFDGLKKEFKETLKGCVNEGYLTEEKFPELWEAYKERNIFSPTFLETAQRMNLAPEDVFSLLDGKEGCETLSQLFTATKNELKRSQAKLVEGLRNLHNKEFDGGMGTYEDFIDLAKERFPSEKPPRIEEATKRLAESGKVSFGIEELGGESVG